MQLKSPGTPLLLSAVLAACGLHANAQSALTPQQADTIQHFRQHQAEILKGPQSALGMVALNSLQPGDTTVGSAPDNTIRLEHAAPHLGILRRQNDTLTFLPAGSFPAGLRIGGKPAIAGPVSFDAEGTSPKFEDGSVNFVLRHKFGFFLVGRDTQAADLLAFHGLQWYAPNGKYRVVARWVPYPEPRVLRIANILGQVNEEKSYGVAEFTVNGKTVHLEPTVRSGADLPLFFVFRDTTSRTTTYQGGRFLDAAMPDHGLGAPGSVVLDFNIARNPLCAFSAHTSCPIPPAQNRMEFPIPAGEKRYHE